uniref:Uncharacterized protein n=1 Tax=Anopheles melas TaxID=34690 RepID=A0A182TUK0_9DIPT
MYPYSRVHGRSNYLPNQRPLEPRYTSAGTAASFLPPPRPPPPSADAGAVSAVPAAGSRLPKPAAAPIGIKPNRWLMPSTAPSPPAAPATISSSQHAAAAAASAAPLSAGVDSLVASYRALNSAHLPPGMGGFQHHHHRLWAEPLPAQQTYLTDLPPPPPPPPPPIGEEEKGLASRLYHPALLAHDAQMTHIAASLQDSFMASRQQQQ